MPSNSSSVAGGTITHVASENYARPLGGSDTISFGLGHDTMFEQGRATVQGMFGQATVAGGVLGGMQLASDGIAASGQATLIGGTSPHDFVSPMGKTPMHSGLSLGSDTLVGAMRELTAGASHSVFEFLSKTTGEHVIKNFISGHDQLYLEGFSFAQLQHHHEISVVGGNTIIKLDGGSTTIELKGVTDLGKMDITTHKPS